MGQIPGGLLVAIEGIDGAGKTTLARALVGALAGVGVPVASSKEPTNGAHGQALRNTAATGRLPAGEELALLLADRAQHVRELIAPALEAGGVVILDRYFVPLEKPRNPLLHLVFFRIAGRGICKVWFC